MTDRIDITQIVSTFREAYDDAASETVSEYRAAREGIIAIEEIIADRVSADVRSENEKLRKALIFYRDKWETTKQGSNQTKTPTIELLDDCGALAREALGETK